MIPMSRIVLTSDIGEGATDLLALPKADEALKTAGLSAELRRRVRHDVVARVPRPQVERGENGAGSHARERHEGRGDVEVEDPLHDAHLLLGRHDREHHVQAGGKERQQKDEQEGLREGRGRSFHARRSPRGRAGAARGAR